MAPGELLSIELPKLQAQLPDLELDPRVSLIVKGQNEQQAESETFLVNAFLIALFVMAIILVTQFNSFYQAFLILSAVLFSTVGVFLGLAIFQKPFGIVMSGIGVIALAGIVVNNAIVLIDRINQLRAEGIHKVQAIIDAAQSRLRPILMTTLTTSLGLLPMALGIGEGAEMRVPMAVTVIFGLLFATLLTLFFIPCLYVLFDRKKDTQINSKDDGQPAQALNKELGYE